ncbi:hypothetical protein DBR43_10025 [Pedobacter sp. KBW06]|uniref:hypothetical protein n=1 Tax=Pedobacter sp. KBW06 TaxID=2153359 RepID=UPI000F5B83EA|nr:hypothetical protein [Pedobacter sp. KBW06]RQO75665.1 hypothetical protein DBR43_10025 [Pedobacter sp. KBW06]
MKGFKLKEDRTIVPEQVIEILSKHRTNVNITEAQLILDFMYKFAKLSVKQALTKDSSEALPDAGNQSKSYR